MAFEPEGHHSNPSKLHLLHGTLPHEVVCTENLTPFLKLLPCKGKAGISSLLDGHKLFDASWQTMAIDVRPVCPNDGSECMIEMEQTVDMVLDIERSKRPRDNPIPRPRPAEDLLCDESKPYHAHGDSCFPLDTKFEPEWNMEEVFGRPIRGSCPLVPDKGEGSETVCLDTPPERIVQPQSSGKFIESKRHDGFSRCFKLPSGADFDLNLPQQGLVVKMPPKPSQLYATRFITGHGQERGGIEAVLTNLSPDNSVDVVYLESIPWFMKPYLHTLQAHVTPLNGQSTLPGHPIKETYYRPGVDRHRGTHLELVITIPPASIVTLTYDFEKAILRYTEYPPDANRGFDAPPAVVRVLRSTKPIPGADMKKGFYLRTTSLLLYLPTPDFSMPYNVIILTSTVMALGFGNIFNLLVRRFVGADEVEGWQAGALRAAVLGKVERITARFKGKGTKAE
jgi:phosphatidylinositol glycan class T